MKPNLRPNNDIKQAGGNNFDNVLKYNCLNDF